MLTLEKKAPPKVNPYILDMAEAQKLSMLELELHHYMTEWDEFWSFVGSKARLFSLIILIRVGFQLPVHSP